MAYFSFDHRKVYFDEIGNGEPMLLLPGNSASSQMFQSIIEMYAQDFKVILIDFPGHGKSERAEKFEADFWYYNAQVCNASLEELERDEVILIGTSGGALVGINFALEYPGKVKYLIADSFMGEYPLPALLTGSKEDEHFISLGKIYTDLKMKNNGLDFHMFEKGSHPAMLSNKDQFYELVKTLKA